MSLTSHEELHAGKAPRASTGHDGAKAPHKLPIRTLVAASAGNAVEWYDWTIYATFSIYFATQIFSAENESLAFILTFTTYALAFFFRPLGGFLLGRYADLKGRKQAMLLTIMLMAGGSLVIAILPTYAAVGWLAPILLLLARIAQGMSLGGEVSSASAYLAEIAPPNRRGRYSSFFNISTGTAVLLASLLGAFLASTLADDQLASWGWRIPFLIGAALGLVGLWMRRDMAETEQFEKNAAKAKAIKNPLMLTLRGNVLPIGGLKEKLLAALRGGITTVMIPSDNVKDLRDIPDNVKNGLELIPVSNVTDVLKNALVRAPEPITWDEAAEAAAAAAAKAVPEAPGAAAH